MNKILIAEDHPVLRAGIRAMLENENDMAVTGEAENGQDALDFLRNHKVDLLLADYAMPVMDGIVTAASVKKEFPEVKVVLFSAVEDARIVTEAVKAGVDGYIIKSDESHEVIHALRRVLKGDNYLSPRISGSTLSFLITRRAECAEKCGHFSSREREILTLVLEGRTNKEIGEKLFISKRTVETHRHNLMRKIGVSSTAELFKYAVKNKLV